jgi:two-component system cell cycle response regulator DivK
MARILVVEDNLVNMNLVVFLLNKMEHIVLQAMDGEQAVKFAHELMPDLILMDMQLPGTDGLTAVLQLKADQATSHIKIIALTAFAMPGDEEKFKGAGCDAYLSKPIRYQDFFALISATLSI